jgi:DNA-binding response OmpR family regulator
VVGDTSKVMTRVLVVEDDAGIADAVVYALEREA